MNSALVQFGFRGGNVLEPSMGIGNFFGSMPAPMQRTNSIGGIHLPDFNDKYVFSKKKSNTSNVEYKKQIAEQAYEDFKNGQFQNKSEGFNKLMKKYTSEVSPDRKGIITSGLKAVSRNKQSGLKPIDLLATILEGMLMCGKATYKNLIDSRPLFRIFFGEIFSKALDYNVAQ
jgi:hypothetical protein